MSRVSFIIPSYNSYKTVSRTLESILRQTAFNSIQEIIVIDSSDDVKTRIILETFHESKITTVLIDRKTSPGEGRNIGAAKAQGNLLCFIDSDVFLDAIWLEKILIVFKEGCLAGSGSVSAPHFQQDKSFALAQLYLQFNKSLDVGDNRTITMVAACNMFVERKLFRRVGGFPMIRASEDTLLCLNIGKVTPVWFIPGARCYHNFREELQSYILNQMVLGKYIMIYRRKIYSAWYYKNVWPLIFLPGFLLIKLIRMKLRIYHAGGLHFSKYLLSSPWFMLGLFFWAVGFIQGSLMNDPES